MAMAAQQPQALTSKLFLCLFDTYPFFYFGEALRCDPGKQARVEGVITDSYSQTIGHCNGVGDVP